MLLRPLLLSRVFGLPLCCYDNRMMAFEALPPAFFKALQASPRSRWSAVLTPSRTQERLLGRWRGDWRQEMARSPLVGHDFRNRLDQTAV